MYVIKCINYLLIENNQIIIIFIHTKIILNTDQFIYLYTF